MDSAKDPDEDSLVRIMARLNDKCQRRGQSYKLFKNDCKIPMPRPSIIRPIKPASNMAVSTPVASKYRQNVSCSFDDMSSIVETPNVEKARPGVKTPVQKTPSVLKSPSVLKTPSVLRTNASTGKEMEVSKNMTIITVNSSSSCHVSSTSKTPRTVKPEPPSVQSDLGETNKRPASFSSNRSASIIDISSASMRPEDSNLSKSAFKSVSQRKDSTYDGVVNRSNGSSRSENKEKDATFDVPTRQQLKLTEPKRDATFEIEQTVSNRKRTNASCRNCLGCSSHDESSSNLNNKSRSPVKSSKSKSFDTSDKAKKSKESNERNKSKTTKNEKPTNVTLSRRMSRSMSILNEVSIGVGVNKTKDTGDTIRGRKNGTNSAAVSKKEPKSTAVSCRVSRSKSRPNVTNTAGNANETKNNREMSTSRKNETIPKLVVGSKKETPKNATLSRRVSRSMSIINDTSIGGSMNETKNNREMSTSTKNDTMSSVGSKKATPKNAVLSRRMSRSMSRIEEISTGGSVNEMKSNRQLSRSRKNETLGTDSVVSKKETPKNAALSRRVSRSMSRIDDISIGSSVYETRSKRNASMTRDNVTTFGAMDTTLTIDKPRFQADFTKSKIREPSVEKTKPSRPQRAATLKEISNVMVDDTTFEKPKSVSRVANRQHKRKQSPSFTDSFCDVTSNQPETKMQKKSHDARREISVQVNEKSLPGTANNGITPRKLTALGDIIPKVDALEKMVKYLTERRPVTPQKRESIPRHTICTQTGKSLEAPTSEKKVGKHSVGVGSDTIDDDEEFDFFRALDIPKIVVSPKLIEYNVDNLPWRLRTPQPKPKQFVRPQKLHNEQNGTVKNIFDSLVESSDDDENKPRSSPRKMYRPSAAVANRKVFMNKRKTTMNVRRSSAQQESLRKALLKKRSRISLKRPPFSSSSDDDEFLSNPHVNVSREKLGNKEQPAGPPKRRLSVVEDFSDAGFSDKENSARASSTTNSLAVKTPTINIPQLTTSTQSTADQYVSKILLESPIIRNTTRRSRTKNGAIKEAVSSPTVPSPVVIRPPSPFEDSFKNTSDDLNRDEVSTSRTDICRKNATTLESEQFNQNPSTSRKSEENCFNEVSTTSKSKNKKNSSNSRVAKTAKRKSKDQFDQDDEPTSSRTTSKTKTTNKKAPSKNPVGRPKKINEVNEDIREGSPTPSEVSLNLRRSSRQRKPTKRLNEVGFINCRSDREYDDWLRARNENIFKIPDVPKTKRRRTIKKSMAATAAKNKPGRKTTNRTTESSQMTNRTTECSQVANEFSQMTNRMTECSQITNRTTECSQMTNRNTGCSQIMSFNGDMSTVSSTAGDNKRRTNKNDVSYCSSKQNDTLQSVDFSTESDHLRIVSNNLQNLHFKSLKEDDNVSVAWTLASNSGRTTTGYLKLEPGALKPKQISANHELSFLVFKGKAKIGVQDTTHIVSTTESFIVPKGMEYYIINVSKTEELLLMFHRFHLE